MIARRPSAGAPLLGSVAHEVLHCAHCPVVVIPERAVAERYADAGRDPAGAAS